LKKSGDITNNAHPEIYAEYEPYNYVEDMKEFIDKVSVLNKIA